MNYNTLRNKPTINHKELIGNNKASDIGGMTEEDMQELLETDLTPYYNKDEIDDLFSRSFVYREKTGSIVTFDCPSTSQTIPEVTTEIVAVQSGSGDPSPTNVRPISGWSAVNVYDGPTTDPQDATVYTTALKDANDQPLTCYGGQLTNENGVQTLDNTMNIVDLGTLNWVYENGIFRLNQPIGAKLTADTSAVANMLCSIYKTVSQNAMGSTSTDHCIAGLNWSNGVRVKDSDYTTVDDFKTHMNGVQLVYELATPQQIPQDSLSIATQEGTNNLWADTGDVTIKALDRIIQG